MPNRRCGYCHQAIPEGVHPYTMRIELFPRVEDSLDVQSGDLEIDFDAEMRALVEQLEAMNEEEVRLQEERIYTRFCFILCQSCRDALASRFGESHHVPDP